MAVTETLELQEGLEATTGQRLCRVVLNELLPRRFTAAELRRLAPYATGAQETGAQGQEGSAGLLAAAVDAAREVHARAVHQHGQVARLRRRNFAVVGLPYLWRAGLDRDALSLLAARLAYGLGTELIR